MEDKKTTIGIIVVAIVILAAIVIFAKPGTKTEKKAEDNTNTQTATEQTTSESDAGELGKNEIEVTSVNFEEKVLKAPAGKLVIVDAYAPWCPHCQKMGPIMSSLADEFAGKATFAKMNANNQDETTKANFDYAINLGLQGYPTFWFYKDGKKIEEKSGEMTKDEFKAEIEKNL